MYVPRFKMPCLVLLFFLVVTTKCQGDEDSGKEIDRWQEPDMNDTVDISKLRIEHRDHTYADINNYRTLHMYLHLTVDMESRTLSGHVDITFVKMRPSWMISKFGPAGPDLVLDLGPHVSVTRVENIETGETLTFERWCEDEPDVAVLECALQIQDPLATVGQFKLRIHYSVTEKTSALHFVPPYQTHDGQHYYLITTTQPSNARGWIPCQDTPALKFPYDAAIRVKHPFTALMSAITTSTTENEDSEWSVVVFKQDIPVPPFLIAITVADIVPVDVNAYSGESTSEDLPPIKVWGERTVMEKVGPSGLLDLISRMMEICVSRFGRYVWGRYDVVLTPPGYMFRGMEFPAMNYISSTNIVYDDLTGPNYLFAHIIAHEMIHSWFGNLVTPKYAGDAWLAEGITSFEELELLEDFYQDPAFGRFYRKVRYSTLKKVLDGYTGQSAKYKILTPYLFGDHPFHGFTYIHYNKGALFLEYLANLTSRDSIDKGLRSYLDRYKYQSVDTADFVHMLYEEYGFESATTIERDIFVWLERPATKVPLKLYPSEVFDDCAQIYRVLTRSKKERDVKWTLKDIAEAYNHGTGALESQAKYLHSQMLVVLERMKSVAKTVEMTQSRLKHWKNVVNRLDKAFHFSDRTESDPETFAAWAALALRFNHAPTVAKTLAFFKQNGRLELVFALLDAPQDFSLRGEFANILRTSYDVDRYPGYIGFLLSSYVDYFISYLEP